MSCNIVTKLIRKIFEGGSMKKLIIGKLTIIVAFPLLDYFVGMDKTNQLKGDSKNEKTKKVNTLFTIYEGIADPTRALKAF